MRSEGSARVVAQLLRLARSNIPYSLSTRGRNLLTPSSMIRAWYSLEPRRLQLLALLEELSWEARSRCRRLQQKSREGSAEGLF